MKKYNNHGIRVLRPNTPEPTNPTRTELARLQRERDLQRIEYFVRGISERVQPKSPAEAAIVREMALATWKLKGTDMAERELSREAARLLGPFKQQAYNDYIAALRKLNAVRAAPNKGKKAA